MVATEFCTRSIGRRGPGAAQTERIRARNPHLHCLRGDRHGGVAFALDTKWLDVQLSTVDRIAEAASPLRMTARCLVDAAQPGPQRDG